MSHRPRPFILTLGLGIVMVLASGALVMTLPGRLALARASGGSITLGGVEFVTIPAGTFTMGSPATEFGHEAREKIRKITIRKPFLLATYETTVAQYKSLMVPAYKSNAADTRKPMTNVSWDEAVDYCRALSRKSGKTIRLPYEDEWEYACRGGTSGPLAIFRGNLDSELAKLKPGRNDHFEQRVSKVINWGSNGVKPVGSYPHNAFGLYDMHGNVWEWCQQLSRSIDDDAPSLPQRPIRGGSWVSRDWFDCRSAKRAWELKDNQKASLGFRVLAEIP